MISNEPRRNRVQTLVPKHPELSVACDNALDLNDDKMALAASRAIGQWRSWRYSSPLSPIRRIEASSHDGRPSLAPLGHQQPRATSDCRRRGHAARSASSRSRRCMSVARSAFDTSRGMA